KTGQSYTNDVVVGVKQVPPVSIAELRSSLRRIHYVGEDDSCENALIVRRTALSGEELSDLLDRILPDWIEVSTWQSDVLGARYVLGEVLAGIPEEGIVDVLQDQCRNSDQWQDV